MNKKLCNSLFILTSIISNGVYAESFNDYVNYESGENREITILNSNNDALIGVTNPGTSYITENQVMGNIASDNEIGEPDYVMFFTSGGRISFVNPSELGDLVNEGYGDYSMSPESVTATPNNRISFGRQDNYFKIKGLNILIDSGTGSAKGVLIEAGNEAEIIKTTLEYKGVNEAVYVENNGVFRMSESSKLLYSNTLGNSYAIYALDNAKIEILGNETLILVKNNTVGVGLKSNSSLISDGIIVSEHGAAVKARTSSVEINGMLLSYDTDKVIDSEDSKVINNGKIKIETDNNGSGIYAKNNIETKNFGTIITADNAVKIVSGANQYSGHFLNSGTITARNVNGKAVVFDDFDNVAEFQNGTDISGKIDGKDGEDILISSGSVKFDEVDNFEKLVSSGDSTIRGTINLSPTLLRDTYYTSAFSTSKSIMSDLAADSSIGELTIEGTVNIGVDYDGINTETDKTGKIIASGIKLNGGKIVLQNAGNTTKNIIAEAADSYNNKEIRIKSIIISNKQQAVNPNLQLELTDDLKETGGWISGTVARLENGVTVLDQLYKNIYIDPTDPKNPEFPEIGTPEKRNPVPRNRVDLDNVNKINQASERFINMEGKDMTVGERRQSIDYIGLKSDFNSSNKYNYDYNTKTNGLMGTTLHKHTENLYSGFTLAYSNNNVNYSNNDEENIKSFNINIFGRYTKGNFDMDTHIQYGFNRHELKADWLGSGKLDTEYNSHILKSGLLLGYNQKITENIKIKPSIGADYLYIKEGTMRTDRLSNIGSTDGKGFIGKVGIELGNTEGKLRWNTGIGYKVNFVDTFHKERRMENEYIMEELNYSKGTVTANIDTDYKITERFSVKAGYEYEKNDDFENYNIKVGFSYILGEK